MPDPTNPDLPPPPADAPAPEKQPTAAEARRLAAAQEAEAAKEKAAAPAEEPTDAPAEPGVVDPDAQPDDQSLSKAKVTPAGGSPYDLLDERAEQARSDALPPAVDPEPAAE